MNRIFLFLCVGMFYTVNLAAQTTDQTIEIQDTKTTTKTIFLSIRGMVCGGCSVSISTALKKSKGVIKQKISYKKGRATITFDPRQTDIKTLIQIITKIGYESRLVKNPKKRKVNEQN